MTLILVASTTVYANGFFDLLELSKTRDPRLNKAQTLQDAQELTTSSRLLQFLPNLSLSSSRSESSLRDGHINTSGLTSNFNIFKGGQDLGSYRAARFNLLQRQQNTLLTELTIEQDITLALLNYLKLQKQKELQDRILELAKENLSITQIRFNQGRVPEADLLKAKVELNNRSEELTNLQTEWELASQDIQRWVMESDLKKHTTWPWPEIKSNYFLNKSANLENISENHPQIASLAFQTQVADQLANSLWGNLLPNLDLQFERNRVDSSLTRSGRYWESSILLLLKIPLFDGLRDVAGLREQRAQARALAYETQFAKTELEANKKALQQTVILSLEALKRRQQTTALAQNLYQQSLKRYKAGLTSYADLSLDMDRWIRSESLLIQGHWQASGQLARWCLINALKMRQCM
jgi:outer membrane protein TolC